MALYSDGLFEEYGKRRYRLKYGLQNRIETYLINYLLNRDGSVAEFKGDFGKRVNSFMTVHRGGDLNKNNFIKFNGGEILLTNKGKSFGNKLMEEGLINRCGRYDDFRAR